MAKLRPEKPRAPRVNRVTLGTLGDLCQKIVLQVIQELKERGLDEVLRRHTRPLFLADIHIRKDVYILAAMQQIIGRALTEQEQRVAFLAGRGRMNKEIAAELKIEVSTVKVHIQRIFDKLQLHSRGEIAQHLAEALPPAQEDPIWRRSAIEPLRELRSLSERRLLDLLESCDGLQVRISEFLRTQTGPTKLTEIFLSEWIYVLHAFHEPDWGKLTAREREVTCLAACLLANKTIAEALGISVRTVTTLLTRGYEKLGVDGRLELPAKWIPRSDPPRLFS